MSNITISMQRDNGYTTFTAQISPKQQRTIIIHPDNCITISGSAVGQAYGSMGRHFFSYQEALGNYKCKKMKAVMEFIPEYIAQGYTGTVSI